MYTYIYRNSFLKTTFNFIISDFKAEVTGAAGASLGPAAPPPDAQHRDTRAGRRAPGAATRPLRRRSPPLGRVPAAPARCGRASPGAPGPAPRRDGAPDKKTSITRSGVRTHADMRPLDLKSNALTTRPSWCRYRDGSQPLLHSWPHSRQPPGTPATLGGAPSHLPPPPLPPARLYSLRGGRRAHGARRAGGLSRRREAGRQGPAAGALPRTETKTELGRAGPSRAERARCRLLPAARRRARSGRGRRGRCAALAQARPWGRAGRAALSRGRRAVRGLRAVRVWAERVWAERAGPPCRRARRAWEAVERLCR